MLALTEKLVQVVDPILLPREVEETATSTVAKKFKKIKKLIILWTCAKLKPMCISA